MKFYKDNVRELLKKDNVTLRKFAKSMGVSHTSVSAWLKGSREPREHNVGLMAKALGVSVTDISDMDNIHDISKEVSGYFQGWGASLNKNKMELEDPCTRAIKEIENIKSEQYRLRTVARAFMSTMHSMLYVKNFHGEYIVANEPYIKAIGLDVHVNMIGKVDKDIMPQKVATENSTEDLFVINTGKSIINKVVKFPFHHSTIKWCLMTKVPLKDNKLNIVGMVTSIIDVTMEKMLRKEEKMMKEMAKHIRASIIVTSIVINGDSIKRNFVYANVATKDILGYTAEDFKKNIYCWYDNIYEPDKYKMVDLMADFRDPQGTRTASCRYKDPITGKDKFLTLKCLRAKGSNLVFNFTYEETEIANKEKEIKKFAKQEVILNEAIKQSNAAIAIVEVNSNKRKLIYANDAVLGLFSIRRRNVNDFSFIDDFYNNIKESDKAAFDKSLTGFKEEKGSFSFSYVDPVTCNEKYITVRSSKMKSNLIYNCFYDDTEKRKNELEHERLKARELLLNEAIKQTNTAIAILSKKYLDVLYINDATVDILGYSREDFDLDPTCWYKNICEKSKGDFAEYLTSVKQDKKSVSFDYLHPITGLEKNIELISSSVKNSNFMCHCLYDNTEKNKQYLEKEKVNAGFKLLATFINKSDSIVFIGEHIENTANVLEYVYRNKKSYLYCDEGEKLENVIVPEQRDEVLKLSSIKRYPRTMIYNIINKEEKICTVEEKIWLHIVNNKSYFLSVMTELEKQNNVKITYNKNLEL